MKSGAFVAILALWCGAAAHAEAPAPEVRAFARPADVHSLIALRELARPQLMALLRLAPADVEQHAAYQKLRDVARLTNAAVYPAHFFVRGDQLQLVYVGDAELLRTLTPAAIRRALGGSGVALRSRAGKRSNQYVYPGLGFAYSETDDAIDFVEVFRPMSLADYRARIYEDVAPFSK